MAKKIPFTVDERHRSLPTELVDTVVGRRIETILYRMPAGVQWWDEYRHWGIHDVDMGVVISLSNQVGFEIDWAMSGFTEGLTLSVRTKSRVEAGGLIDVVDVGELPEWQKCLGRAIQEITCSSFVSNEGAPRTVWAVKFRLEDAVEFAIALGEFVEGRPHYAPDSIMVIMDESVGRSYRITGSDRPAWSA
ncbi:hypothetical protein [Amycolatopsis thermoflava]|uniref:hypothetical protein n=1 Tax=Amycolatopsis thermoflava TaxID=84480 RepID=UPI0011CE6434|nr:hypothetical protein [Amycolatopsis thermoflava]